MIELNIFGWTIPLTNNLLPNKLKLLYDLELIRNLELRILTVTCQYFYGTSMLIFSLFWSLKASVLIQWLWTVGWKWECMRRHQISFEYRLCGLMKEWACKTADLPPTQWADTRICRLSALLPWSQRPFAHTPIALRIKDITVCHPNLMLRSCSLPIFLPSLPNEIEVEF